MKLDDYNEFPPRAQAAFEAYPEFKPTAAFNRAVLERVEAENARRQLTFVGRIEEFLGLDLWRFAASGMLGALVPGLILGGLFLANRGNGSPSPQPDQQPITALQSLGPFYARELDFDSDMQLQTAPQPTTSSPHKSISGGEISCVGFTSHLV